MVGINMTVVANATNSHMAAPVCVAPQITRARRARFPKTNSETLVATLCYVQNRPLRSH
jgi:hypothetical protein